MFPQLLRLTSPSTALALLNADSAIGNELYVYDVNVQRTYNFIPVFFSDDRDAIVGNYTGVPLVSQYASPELMNNALVFVNQWTPPLETVVEVTLSGRNFLGVVVSSSGLRMHVRGFVLQFTLTQYTRSSRKGAHFNTRTPSLSI